MSIKFKDYGYIRPDIKKIEDEFNKLIFEFENAANADEQYNILLKIDASNNEYATMRNIAAIRYTINTEDKFYNEENEYFNNAGPVFSELIDKFDKVFVNSKFRQDLELKTGKYFFEKIDLSMKTFKPEIIEDLKIENHLVTEYVKLTASAKINFEGKERNVAWEDYKNLCKAGGKRPFLELLNDAKFESPFEKKTLKTVIDYCKYRLIGSESL